MVRHTESAAEIMKQSLTYRSFDVSNEDGKYIARSSDGEECQLSSKYLLRVLRAIDTLWAALDGDTQPIWFSDWTQSTAKTLDLDQAVGVMDDLPQECRVDHHDPISVLQFPVSPKSQERLAAVS